MDKELTFFWEIVPGIFCNLKCKNCYAAANARPDQRLLDWDSMKIALEKAIAIGTKTIDVLGGEPLLYPHLKKFINYFISKSHAGFCGIVSNGTLITRERARLLADCGVSQMSISLDGTMAATNDANRGKGTFHQALKGIENLIKTEIPLTIAYTVTQFNLSDTYKVFSFAQKLGAKAAAIQITDPFGCAKTSLEKIKGFNRIEGLKAICQMYHTKPPLYTEVNSRSLFQEFLNRFFNADLTISPKKCEGGLKTFMVSSGGDLYPCSEYAYFHNGSQRHKGVNLVTDDFKTIKDYVEHRYAEFNLEMRLVASEKFTTCKICQYQNSCSPCPVVNPAGEVSECEWVRVENEELTNSILRSRLELLIEPVKSGSNEISFPTATQKQSIRVPMNEKVFKQLMASRSVSQIIDQYMINGKHSRKSVINWVIEFLCKLRSHHVIEIEKFRKFLDTELKPSGFPEKTS